ncbi:serine hydrolase domain-containing protein [Virgisporangium ochraceum]|uniref:serine hydrolase domain-containing protein n=1 Tax=Virgisporangium ochraceum TaxID=65505 RepID=UPI0019443A8F|nr:serine hydrolase domain-containing protein [Virgisporangium ochraceum]
MTSTSPRRGLSRRGALGLLGAAVPVAAGGLVAVTNTAEAGPQAPAVPAGLRPGGEFDRMAADLAAQDRFSGTVLLVHRRRPVLARSYGLADKARGAANGPDTIFSLGSITKLFTAVAIAQLVEQGKVDYHERIGSYLTGLPSELAAATVHHLVTHAGGQRDYMADPEYWKVALTWDTVEEVWEGSMSFARRDPVRFVPGSAYEYSNSGYHLLGAIVAAVSGRSYHDYVRHHVFRRAGMTTADFYTTAHWRDDRRIARPYAGQPPAERVDRLDAHIFVGSPAGGAHACAPDLVRFADALRGDRLLSAPFTHLLHGAKAPRGRRTTPFGVEETSFATYAPMAILSGSQWLYWHNGGAPGVSTELAWYPTSDWTTVMLSNYDQATMSLNALSRKLITT